MTMNKKLIATMHWSVLASTLTIAAVIILNRIEMDNSSTGDLGNSLFYSLIYTCALAVGFIGWMLAAILLAKERRNRTKHSAYAVTYLVLGIGGFMAAYYLMQAS